MGLIEWLVLSLIMSAMIITLIFGGLEGYEEYLRIKQKYKK